MMIKKQLSRILSITLLCALGLYSCAGDEGEVVLETSGEETTTDAASEYTKPELDCGGETFTIASYNFDMGYAVCNYTMISHDEEDGDIINDSIIDMTRRVEDDFNVRLELMELGINDRTSTENFTKSIYAGEDLYQAGFPVTACLRLLLSEPSLLCDLSSIATLDLERSWWDQNSVAEYDIGGRQYTVSGDICFFAKSAPVVNFVNKQMLEDYSLDDPYQLVRDGRWTLDKMKEMAAAASHDLNGNGEVDVDDSFGFMNEPSSVSYFMIGFGIDYSTRGSDDSIELSFYSDRAATAIEKLVPFMRDKTTTLYAQDYMADYSNDPYGLLFQPTFMSNRALFYSNQLLLALDFRGMDADFGILPLPKLDESQPEYCSTTNIAWCDNLIVPATNTDLERTGYILEAMGYYSQQLVTPAFIETTVLGKSLRDEDSAEMIELIYSTQVYDIALMFDWGGIANMLKGLANSESTNLASEYAKYESQIAAAMEKTMSEFGR